MNHTFHRPRAKPFWRERRERQHSLRHLGTHTEKEWEALKSSVKHRCVKCTEKLCKLTKDHIVPVVLGGSDRIGNLQPLCSSCNYGKLGDTTNWLALRRKRGWGYLPEQDMPIPWPWSHYLRFAQEIKNPKERRTTLRRLQEFEREAVLLLPTLLKAVLNSRGSSRLVSELVMKVQSRRSTEDVEALAEDELLEVEEFTEHAHFLLWELYHHGLISWQFENQTWNASLLLQDLKVKIRRGKRKAVVAVLQRSKTRKGISIQSIAAVRVVKDTRIRKRSGDGETGTG